MEESITAYQGKFFSVTLQSYLGSTNYGWCLISMPAELILVGQVNESANGLSLVNQMFYFIPITASKEKSIELEFGLCCLSQISSKLNPFKFEEKVKVMVNLVPSNDQDSRKFVRYSENSATYSPTNNMDLMAALKYGFPPALKYGYPCDQNDMAALKYGYPCGQDDCATVKYGYPPAHKYGYPCSQDDMALMKYGYPPALKYGYPCDQGDCE